MSAGSFLMEYFSEKHLRFSSVHQTGKEKDKL